MVDSVDSRQEEEARNYTTVDTMDPASPSVCPVILECFPILGICWTSGVKEGNTLKIFLTFTRVIRNGQMKASSHLPWSKKIPSRKKTGRKSCTGWKHRGWRDCNIQGTEEWEIPEMWELHPLPSFPVCKSIPLLKLCFLYFEKSRAFVTPDYWSQLPKARWSVN